MLPKIVPVVEQSQVSEARRIGLKLAFDLGWDETSTGKLAIVLTEAATNLVKHAKGGQIHVRICGRGESSGIEVLAIDTGPGVADLDQCLTDGYSTTASPGTGLGAIARLADEFDIYSQPGHGTCLVARLFAGSAKGEPSAFQFGVVRMPVRGETECGDNWGVRTEGSRTVLVMADGLGHGPGAAEASGEAVSVLERATNLTPANLLEQIHHALRSTRGAAVAVAEVDTERKEVRFAGAGNISGLVIGPSSVQHMISHNGTAGQNIRKFQEFVYPWTRTSLIVMHSDGVTTSWRHEAYPGLVQRDPSLLAATLLRDASRGRDDVCVLVGRDRG